MRRSHTNGDGAVFVSTSQVHRRAARRTAGSQQDKVVDDTKQDQKRYCPYCGMTSFEVSGEEEGSLYCEYCGVDVEVKELIP